MTLKDFWSNSKVGVVGGGVWGTVLANLISGNCREVRIWARDEESVRVMNATRVNARYLPEMQFNEKVHATSDLDRFFYGGLNAVIWALPSEVCRAQAKIFAPRFRGDELILHATKGIEPGTMKRVSEVLSEEFPCRRIGVISGPNLAHEVARGDPSATIVASKFVEVCEAGKALLSSSHFKSYCANDVIGVEWAGVLKNILAIACGAIDALKMGWNTKAMLMTRGLAEMVRFGEVMGAKESTFLGLAGVGDLFATCSGPLSRNYRVGYSLAQGDKIEEILLQLGSTAEGVRTSKSVWEFASKHKIAMPITEGVCQLVYEGRPAKDVINQFM